MNPHRPAADGAAAAQVAHPTISGPSAAWWRLTERARPPVSCRGAAGAVRSLRTSVLERAPSSARQARLLLEQACADLRLPQDALDSARLLLSEIVTNAVVHALSAPVVVVSAGSGGLGVAVVDGSTRPPRRGDASQHALGGRGMALVEALADAWGWHPLPGRDGKVVWFEVRAAVAGERDGAR
ncbi:hypothetical protein NUM3379_03730 [Kineococcus sp. NUM-3379]